jgi:hypothetical protein
MTERITDERLAELVRLYPPMRNDSNRDFHDTWKALRELQIARRSIEAHVMGVTSDTPEWPSP